MSMVEKVALAMVNDEMRRELHPLDTIVFANGCEARPADRNYSDTTEKLP